MTTKTSKKSESEDFKCSECDFVLKSKNGLKTHKARMHTKTKSLEYPFDCELCDAKLENEKDMKEDLRFYRYKNIFLNVKTLTMCVKHFCLRMFMLESSMLEIIECGLCNFEAKDIEHM